MRLKRWMVLLVVLALCVGATTLFPIAREERRNGSHASHLRKPAEAIPLSPPAGLDVRQPLLVPSPPAIAESAESIHEQPQEGSGTITGFVLDQVNGVLEHHLVFFMPPDSESYTQAHKVEARSDPGGAYEIGDVPAGRWSGFYVGQSGDRMSSALLMGEVEVRPNQVSTFDFFVTGNRTLEGAFDIPEYHTETGGAMLELELRSAWVPDLVVARGATYRNAIQRPFPPDELTNDPNSGRGPRERDTFCYFSFSGLEPDRYVLRVIVGKEVEQGIPIYIERDVDLVDGDQVLPNEVLMVREFDENLFRILREIASGLPR